MPHEYSEADIRAFWQECGAIESITLMAFKDSGRFNGALFITFATQVEPGTRLAVTCGSLPASV